MSDHAHSSTASVVSWAMPLAALALITGGQAWPLAVDQPHRNPLDLPLTVAEPRRSVPLQEALCALAQSPREGFVLFGLEEHLSDGKQPTVNLNIKPGMTVGTALREIIAQLPPYEMEPVSDHLIDLRPKGAKDDPSNVLNLRVATFDAISKPAYEIIAKPRNIIPELNRALRPKAEAGKVIIELYSGGPAGGPLVTLHLRNLSIRDILNAASAATEASFKDHKPDAPRGWVVVYDPSPPPGNSNYSFRSFFCLPSYWHYDFSHGPNPSEQ